MSDRCVIICASQCNGYFHDELWPYLREMYEMFQHDQMNTLPDLNRYGEYFATNAEYPHEKITGMRKKRLCYLFPQNSIYLLEWELAVAHVMGRKCGCHSVNTKSVHITTKCRNRIWEL